ncbi:MAG: NUDIX domain-containing protein [Cyclobacteriaceae bacterium]|nr:NUDIX domain-containing protein [Cyclobacteriaceae bacterium]
MKSDKIEFFRESEDIFLRHLSVDCVIFGVFGQTLKVLALKWKDNWPWAIPGGFVRHNESLDAAAARAVLERLGILSTTLVQVHAFGDPGREVGKASLVVSEKPSWMDDRFVSVCYYGVVKPTNLELQVEDMFEKAEWFEPDSLPALIFDHASMVSAALAALRDSLFQRPFGKGLLPPTFALTDLQQLYETILDKPLDTNRFQQWITTADLLRPAPEASGQYRFNDAKYAARAIRPF